MSFPHKFMSRCIDDICWFPMYCSYRSELKVKRELDRLHVACYLPMEYQLVEHDGERRRQLVPAIHNLIFVHDSQREITRLKMYNKVCTSLQYMVRSGADDEKSEILWDAASYDQVNPQLTREDGTFGWDVPEGQWLVKFTKEGYEDADSRKDAAADESEPDEASDGEGGHDD